jgi:hypothetical protein
MQDEFFDGFRVALSCCKEKCRLLELAIQEIWIEVQTLKEVDKKLYLVKVGSMEEEGPSILVKV